MLHFLNLSLDLDRVSDEVIDVPIKLSQFFGSAPGLPRARQVGVCPEVSK